MRSGNDKNELTHDILYKNESIDFSQTAKNELMETPAQRLTNLSNRYDYQLLSNENHEHETATMEIQKTKHFRRDTILSSALVPFLFLILYGCFHSTYAAPQSSCILCDKQDISSLDVQNQYEEFLFEHQVSRQDAINALRSFNDSLHTGDSSDNSCISITCDKKVMKYCLGPQFINDHCWCELGRSEEGLPFVPHICYVGEKIYTASVGSCFFYEEVKECCCGPALAKQWRHISAAVRSSVTSNRETLLVCLSLLILHVAGVG